MYIDTCLPEEVEFRSSCPLDQSQAQSQASEFRSVLTFPEADRVGWRRDFCNGGVQPRMSFKHFELFCNNLKTYWLGVVHI